MTYIYISNIKNKILITTNRFFLEIPIKENNFSYWEKLFQLSINNLHSTTKFM